MLALAACDGAFVAEPTHTPAPPGSQLPHLAADAAGHPVLSWVEDHEDGHRLVYTVLDSGEWRPPVVVAEGPGWFVNWADFPSVQPLTADLWAAHWLVKQPGGMYAYDIAIALSRDGGRTWGPAFTPHDDGTPTEHGFVSLWPATLPDGGPGLGAAWLDGRHTLIDASRTGAPTPRMTLRSALFDASGDEIAGSEVDGMVCDCCQTSVAVTPEGPMLAYRDRTETEVRDVHTALRTASAWQPQGTVAEDGWTIAGCPVNGPAVAAAGNRREVAWYTEAGGDRQVKHVHWDAGRRSWSAPAIVHSGNPLGRVDVALLDEGAAVSWMAREDGGAAILVARVGTDGRASEPLKVATTVASRPAGFPRMIRHGNDLLLAWTRWSDDEPRVVTTRVAVSDL